MSKRGNISWSMTYYMTMVHVITYRKEICVVGVRVGEYFGFCLKDARHPRRKKYLGPANNQYTWVGIGVGGGELYDKCLHVCQTEIYQRMLYQQKRLLTAVHLRQLWVGFGDRSVASYCELGMNRGGDGGGGSSNADSRDSLDYSVYISQIGNPITIVYLWHFYICSL